jgi:kynurenine formamidase
MYNPLFILIFLLSLNPQLFAQEGSMQKFPYTMVDLTHTIDEKIPTWDGVHGFKKELTIDYSQCKSEVKFRAQKFTTVAGIGTHMDSPAHTTPGGATIDEIPLEQLIAPCVVIDISASSNEHYSLTPQDIELFEKTHAPIQKGDFVMVRTGWEKFWDTPEKYRNGHKFPSVSKEAAELLLQRGVVGLGIDTLSSDRPEDGFPVHKLFLGNGKYFVENAANLEKLPPTGSFILCLPIKIKDGTEAPIRLIGLIGKSL